MVTIRLRTVDLLQFTGLTRLQVEQPLLTLFMPDGEITIVHQGKEDILAVVGRPRPRQALPHRHGIEDGIDLFAVFPRLRVEGNLTEVVFLILVVSRIVLLLTCHIIQVTPVRREHR